MGAIFHGTGIESRYVDRVSITYDSSPQKHIWTYAGGYNESNSSYNDYNCPCINGKTVAPPSFISDNYYCESAPGIIDTSDILWDGQ